MPFNEHHSHAQKVRTLGVGTLLGMALTSSLLSACGGGSDAVPEVAKYVVGGTAQGLVPGKSLVLQTNWGETLTLQEDGSFVFNTKQPSGTAYAVSIKSGPADMQCSVPTSSGTVQNTAVNTLRVRCVMPGELPTGDWEQGACSPYTGSDHKSSRAKIADAKADANNLVSFFHVPILYANADCTGAWVETPKGKPTAVGFSASRVQHAANRSVYWGSGYPPFGASASVPTIWVRQDNQLCVFSDLDVDRYPDAASLDAVVETAIAQRKCYTPS
jgi:hypothetical protein